MPKDELPQPKHFRRGPIWLQVAAISLLYLGSILALFWNAYAGFQEPREVEVRGRLRRAARQMDIAAENAEADALGRLAEQVLAEYQGVEGGYFRVSDGAFIAAAFPTEEPKSKSKSKSKPHRPSSEPPPKEFPYILLQCRQAAGLPSSEDVSNILDVGPSRVAIVTRAVGTRRPTLLVVWTMYRITKPEDLHAQLIRYRTSLGLALGGLFLSMLLMLNLARLLTRQRQAEDRLREELRKSAQLAALGKLLAGVAHEVRNPLAGIRSTVELWQRLPETSQTESSRTAVLHAVDRLNELVSRLLFFARTPHQSQHVQINDIIRDVCDLFAAQAQEQSVQIRIELDPGLPQVLAPEGSLRQVIINLTTNALTAMPSGGVLTWKTSTSGKRDAIEVTVADTGPGIPLQVREHLFEPFFTTRPEGTGLGLSLCHEIMTQLAGDISLVSPPGEAGTTFRFRLPTGDAPAGDLP